MIKIGDYILTKQSFNNNWTGKIKIEKYDDCLYLLDSGEFDEKELAEVIDKFYREKF